MATLKEEAKKYEKQTTKNIADLKVFDINMELETFHGVDMEGKNFAYKFITDKDGTRYRVPFSVLGMIKAYLEDDETLSLFKVKKSGEGKNTVYTTIPIKPK